MEIRKLTKEDSLIAKHILANFMESPGIGNEFPSMQHLTDLLTNPTCYLIAALQNDTPAGFALAYRFPSLYAAENTAYLYDIEVLPGHRQKGIGRKLIQELLIHLKKDKVNEIWLGTDRNNIPAQKLFSSTGAEREGDSFYEYFYYLK